MITVRMMSGNKALGELNSFTMPIGQTTPRYSVLDAYRLVGFVRLNGKSLFI